MRHGEAEPYQEMDRERALSNFGLQQAEDVGQQLAEYVKVNFAGENITAGLVSPYVRAQQTYEQVSKHIEIKSKEDCDMVLPESDSELFADYLHALAAHVNAPENLLIVSHMPFVSLLADELCDDFNGKIFATADMLIIDYDHQTERGERLAMLTSDRR